MKNTISIILIVSLILALAYAVLGIMPVKASTEPICLKYQKTCNTGVVDSNPCGKFGQEYEGQCCRAKWEGWKLTLGKWEKTDVCLEYEVETPPTPIAEPNKAITYANGTGGGCSESCRRDWTIGMGWLKADISTKFISLQAQITSFKKLVDNYLSSIKTNELKLEIIKQ